MHVRPARDVAGRINPSNARLQEGIHDDAAVGGETGLLGQHQTRPHTHADYYKVGVESATTFEHRASAVDRTDRVLEMKDDAMYAAHERSRPFVARAGVHRPLFRRHHMNLDVACAQRGRGL
jgi:hypothetical protein